MRFLRPLFLLFTLLSFPFLAWSQCTLKIPNSPLTAAGLATPFELSGCNQLDFADQGVFVEANIFDPATGNIQIYNPLVINAGMTSTGNNTKHSSSGGGAGFFIPPVTPTVPNGAVIALWFGSNANTLTLTGDTNTCVNGLGTSVFGQVAYCNAPAWFTAVNGAVASGLVRVPVPGTGLNNQACPTTRDFRIVDQDQSDNVVTTYLLINKNTLAQHTPENAQANPDAEVLSNGSDNSLLNDFIQPALKCTPYQNPCATCPTGQSAALSTNELQGAFYPPASGPALVPLNDPMVLVDGKESLDKVNLYRAGVGQPTADQNNASGTTYCQQFAQSGIFIASNENTFAQATSPAADQATNLFTFLAMRFSTSFGPAPGLGCVTLLNVDNPVKLTMDGNGVVTAAVINTSVLQQILGGGSVSSSVTTATTNSQAVTTTSSRAATSAHMTSTLHASGVRVVTTTSAAFLTSTQATSAALTISASAATASPSNFSGGSSAPSHTHTKHHNHTTNIAASPTITPSAAGSSNVATTMITPNATCATISPGASGTQIQTVTVTVTATACPTKSAEQRRRWPDPSAPRPLPRSFKHKRMHKRAHNRMLSLEG
ncbi:hypothetical protein EDC04DRAFT_482180 [Pisolithus marmoratus]|nr:hypothetical protein EDC04DRAFT_482180 [Pisolithus marmoratus]